MMAESPPKGGSGRDGRLLRLRLSRPKANLIDADMIAALDAALTEHQADSGLLAVLVPLERQGSPFQSSQTFKIWVLRIPH